MREVEKSNRVGIGTNKALHLTMFTTFGLTPNEYSGSAVQKSLTMDVLFAD
ncbi:MAG: hypothetical protein AAB316_13815 [Bacteroidota bacterium]